ncbi:prion-inhibition and propagation-domain-containing protein [Lophiotrema nucula]|uniref:Prion-inhibition and propagation-domain-containing protein n=1 Tax=Lophiotrema nucula TaxID=690887 RepID=A0A6A5YXG3_9PLEO|nr:prion-inhibition and propagation-domain-containing protein [Lophiotrema nucula]
MTCHLGCPPTHHDRYRLPFSSYFVSFFNDAIPTRRQASETSNMSGFGEAAAAISLTVQLFSLSVDGLRAISRARHSTECILNFSIKLDLEIARLVLWGRNSGLTSGRLDPTLEPIRLLLASILGTLSSSIQNADELKGKYGIRLAEESKLHTPATNPPTYRTLETLDILAAPMISRELERQRELSQKIKSQTTMFQKTKWAVFDGVKAVRFVDDIKSYVDSLNQLLTESQKSTLDSETAAMRIAILGTNWAQPIKMLSTLEKATLGRYESIALPARLSRLRLELEMEEATPSLPGPEAIPEGALPLGYDQMQALNADMSLANFDNKTVLIEWRTLKPSEAAGETGRARMRQAVRLAGMFRELRSLPTDYLVLECFGYVDQRDHIPARLGIVFNIPPMPRVVTSPPTKPFNSLYEYLSLKDFEDFRPSLGARFDLARKIASGFLQFHQLGWLHKCIRSHNIAFFPESERLSIQSPHILGFAFSRPSETGISDRELPSNDLKLYQHPAYQGREGTGYKLVYDFYSIGLLLFEIGKWKPLDYYFRRLQTQGKSMSTKLFGSRLIELESDELEFRTGTHYKTAVLTCLRGDFEMEGEEPGEKQLKLAYFDKVVKSLDLCRA